jgi:tetratricopeptide (TPR) repeat protein
MRPVSRIVACKSMAPFTRLAVTLALLFPAWAIAQPAPDWQTRQDQRLEACLALTETDAERAYEEGLAWRAQMGGPEAGHCIAAALVARGDLETGAARFMALANAADAGTDVRRALLFSKAANAWLLAGDAAPALEAIERALLLAPARRELLADQAVALSLLERWSEAETVLDGLIGSGTADALLLRLRAEARLQQGKLDGADADVEAAIAAAPSDIDNYVMRGRAREARRLGRPAGNVH